MEQISITNFLKITGTIPEKTLNIPKKIEKNIPEKTLNISKNIPEKPLIPKIIEEKTIIPKKIPEKTLIPKIIEEKTLNIPKIIGEKPTENKILKKYLPKKTHKKEYETTNSTEIKEIKYSEDIQEKIHTVIVEKLP